VTDPIQEERSFKRGLLVIVCLLVIAFVVTMTYLYQKNKPREADVYLIPQGYTGLVTVQYNIPGGPELEKEGKHYVFHIPPDGKLDTSTPEPNYGVAQDKYYYVDASGKRTELQYGRDIHGVFLGRDEDDLSKPLTGSFFVGTEQQWQEWNRQMHEEKMKKEKEKPRRYY
jgi:hypothetical protein